MHICNVYVGAAGGCRSHVCLGSGGGGEWQSFAAGVNL
jgi:hypothetical protein